MSAGPRPGRILVIKLGALGDFVQALGPFAAIRRHHADHRITLLTTAPFVDLAGASGLFDQVVAGARVPWWRAGTWLALRRWLRGQGYRRVYDLQTADRSSALFHLMGPGPRPEWSGIARGCSHPHANPRRDYLHTIDRQREQLQMAGIGDVPAADLSFLVADVARFNLTRRYLLLVPGGSAKRPAKRWPAERFAALAATLHREGVTPVVLGGPDERGLAQAIVQGAGGVDLTGRTSLADIAVLARGAAAAVGNDTGPMHLIAASDCPSVVLFSAESDPALCAPRGRLVKVLRRDRLADLEAPEVAAALVLR
ncbi:MAG: glycosyltransferase family 9 protein [Alphaproteobacteria bacterium]|nr:glycosyltransferase family 9 protein [Alphaproteobacteria bacterium]